MKYTNEQLLNSIVQKQKELGRTPTKRELKHEQVIRTRFGSLNKALKILNLPLNRKNDLTRKDHKEAIVKWAKENNRSPRIQDFLNNPALPNPNSIKRKFNCSWPDVLKKYKI